MLDVHTPAADPVLAEMGSNRERALAKLHVLDQTGRLHLGIDAFAVLWSHLPYPFKGM